MGTSSKELARKLQNVAKRQHGCFTAAQAIKTGYADSVHLYHVKAEHWIRLYRGVYRLATIPATPASRCMAALLWTRDKNGVIQGALAPETTEALASNSLGPEQPIQIVVDKKFRRSSSIPDGIEITVESDIKHKTSKISGLCVLAPASPPAKLERSHFQDINDYYDWIDYQNSRCLPHD
ncbi:MAG: type IV toxin-antitoxin system AbiEi family antitoxin domain-containing protein [Kiritimatiellia bacterium]|jgi:hypothetical protein|nr:type IV toxin-antitoxin system AbiEi family antitoxin domain-containing protein [Kiritimatiellia bacterium]